MRLIKASLCLGDPICQKSPGSCWSIISLWTSAHSPQYCRALQRVYATMTWDLCLRRMYEGQALLLSYRKHKGFCPRDKSKTCQLYSGCIFNCLLLQYTWTQKLNLEMHASKYEEDSDMISISFVWYLHTDIRTTKQRMFSNFTSIYLVIWSQSLLVDHKGLLYRLDWNDMLNLTHDIRWMWN